MQRRRKEARGNEVCRRARAQLSQAKRAETNEEPRDSFCKHSIECFRLQTMSSKPGATRSGDSLSADYNSS